MTPIQSNSEMIAPRKMLLPDEKSSLEQRTKNMVDIIRDSLEREVEVDRKIEEIKKHDTMRAEQLSKGRLTYNKIQYVQTEITISIEDKPDLIDYIEILLDLFRDRVLQETKKRRQMSQFEQCLFSGEIKTVIQSHQNTLERLIRNPFQLESLNSLKTKAFTEMTDLALKKMDCSPAQRKWILRSSANQLKGKEFECIDQINKLPSSVRVNLFASCVESNQINWTSFCKELQNFMEIEEISRAEDREKERNEILQALLKEEEESKTKKVKVKSLVPKLKRTVKQAKERSEKKSLVPEMRMSEQNNCVKVKKQTPVPVESCVATQFVSETATKNQQGEQTFENIHNCLNEQNCPVKIHQRVSRWGTIKTLSDIQKFPDKKSDGKLRYSRMTQETLVEQLSRHYMPSLLVQLLQNSDFRNLYCIQTEKGLLLKARLNEGEWSFLTIGKSSTDVIFHAFFLPPTELQIIEEGFYGLVHHLFRESGECENFEQEEEITMSFSDGAKIQEIDIPFSHSSLRFRYQLPLNLKQMSLLIAAKATRVSSDEN